MGHFTIYEAVCSIRCTIVLIASQRVSQVVDSYKTGRKLKMLPARVDVRPVSGFRTIYTPKGPPERVRIRRRYNRPDTMATRTVARPSLGNRNYDSQYYRFEFETLDVFVPVFVNRVDFPFPVYVRGRSNTTSPPGPPGRNQIFTPIKKGRRVGRRPMYYSKAVRAKRNKT